VPPSMMLRIGFADGVLGSDSFRAFCVFRGRRFFIMRLRNIS